MKYICIDSTGRITRTLNLPLEQEGTVIDVSSLTATEYAALAQDHHLKKVRLKKDGTPELDVKGLPIVEMIIV